VSSIFCVCFANKYELKHFIASNFSFHIFNDPKHVWFENDLIHIGLIFIKTIGISWLSHRRIVHVFILSWLSHRRIGFNLSLWIVVEPHKLWFSSISSRQIIKILASWSFLNRSWTIWRVFHSTKFPDASVQYLIWYGWVGNVIVVPVL
jgi:hypothetical protein